MCKILWVLSTALVLNGVASAMAQAQVVNATTDVHGLTCPFCAFGAKKKLRSVEGVKKVTVDVDQGVAVLHSRPGESIQLRQIAPATRQAGFEPGTVRIVAIGRIESKGEDLHFVLKDSDEIFVLVPSETVSQELLKQWGDRSEELKLAGVWSISEGETHAQMMPDAMTEL